MLLDEIALRECAWHAEDCARSIRKRGGSEEAAAAYDRVAAMLHGLHAASQSSSTVASASGQSAEAA